MRADAKEKNIWRLKKHRIKIKDTGFAGFAYLGRVETTVSQMCFIMFSQNSAIPMIHNLSQLTSNTLHRHLGKSESRRKQFSKMQSPSRASLPKKQEYDHAKARSESKINYLDQQSQAWNAWTSATHRLSNTHPSLQEFRNHANGKDARPLLPEKYLEFECNIRVSADLAYKNNYFSRKKWQKILGIPNADEFTTELGYMYTETRMFPRRLHWT
jgi:hypothetical protein